MRTHGTAKVEGQFHFSERLLQLGSEDCTNYSIAFVAYNIGLISANQAIQTPTTIWIAEGGLRHCGAHHPFDAEAVTYGAIARPGKRREIAVAVSATCIVAIANWNAPTARRGRQRTHLRLIFSVHGLSVRRVAALSLFAGTTIA
jgi:hypothetical protein